MWLNISTLFYTFSLIFIFIYEQYILIFMIKTVIDFLTERPLFGAATGFGGGLAALMTKVQILTPVIGFFAAVTGLLIGLLTLILKSKEVYEMTKTWFDNRKNSK